MVVVVVVMVEAVAAAVVVSIDDSCLHHWKQTGEEVVEMSAGTGRAGPHFFPVVDERGG